MRRKVWYCWWRAFPIVVVLVAVGYVGYRYWKPPVRVAAEGKGYGEPLIGGFLAEDDSGITLHSWTTGATLWSIPRLYNSFYSPSGAWGVTNDTSTHTLNFYHNGAKTGSYRLPLTGANDEGEMCCPLDDGRVILIIWQHPRYRVFVLRNGEVLARGTYKFSGTGTPPNGWSPLEIADDGAGFVVRTFEESIYVLLTIDGDTCRFNERDHLTGGAFITNLFPGAAWTDDAHTGKMGRPGGVISLPKDFYFDSIVPGSPYAAGYYAAADGMHLVTLAPATGDSWGVVFPGSSLNGNSFGCDTTPDGQYLLVRHVNTGNGQQFTQWMNDHIPWEWAKIKGYAPSLPLTMYRRPGIVTARMNLDLSNIGGSLQPYWPAPDGHGVVVYGEDKWRLYRW